jgi:sortase A
MKSKLSTIFLFVMLFVGISLLLYPTVSDYWNSFHQSAAIADYTKKVATLSTDDYEAMLTAARQYNEELLTKSFRWKLSDEEKAEYESLLDISGTGIMGYVEVPSINVSLPIYHGTSEGVLQTAVGHLEGSSLPIGGASTHSVISGHRGLPSAKLFTDLDKLNKGDRFVVRVLDEVYTYEVDRILIVQPDDLSGLTIENGMDYCTLVTCTPYAVNTHRLLVRGHRVENDKEAKQVKVTSDAMQIEPVVVAPIVAAPMLFILFVVMMVTTSKGKDKSKK